MAGRFDDVTEELVRQRDSPLYCLATAGQCLAKKGWELSCGI